MNDADTRIKDLINSAVDRELAGHRSAPPLDRPELSDRSHSDRSFSRWAAPVLAASVAALLTVGTVLAIGSDRDRRSNPAANTASPRPSVSPSVSRSTDPDPKEAARAYAEAVAGAREASEVAGVTVRPATAEETAKLQGSGVWTLTGPAPKAPVPGKSYPVTLGYLVGPGEDPVAVLSGELSEVASGSCPEPFLVRPGHNYSIRCQVTFLAGFTGKLTFAPRTPTGTPWTYTFPLGDPASRSASPSTGPEQQEAAREYSEAVASAPEASKLAGVSDRPATADERRSWETLGVLKSGPASPDPGRSYPITLLYIPAADMPLVEVLTIKVTDVAVGRCPGPFRTRPGHAYLIHCQVTYQAGAKAMAYYHLIGPHGGNRAGSGVGLSPA